MYTGFEGLEEAEKSTPRAYVSNVSQEEAERLLRDNERLKKSLEKEKFFNKLLDQEIQELRTNKPTGNGSFHYSEYWSGNRGIPKRTFYSLLLISLVMASYIGYSIYNDNQYNYLQPSNAARKLPGSPTTAIIKKTNSEGQSQMSTSPGTPANAQRQNNIPTHHINPIIKDSVPNIIGDKKQPAVKEKSVAFTEPAAEYDEAEVEAIIGEGGAADPYDNKPVIGKYKVVSKANFYTSPDENTLRSTFITQSTSKVVDALEDKNNFIFVVYTNDLGYTSRGWLSKKDLAKVD